MPEGKETEPKELYTDGLLWATAVTPNVLPGPVADVHSCMEPMPFLPLGALLNNSCSNEHPAEADTPGCCQGN